MKEMRPFGVHASNKHQLTDLVNEILRLRNTGILTEKEFDTLVRVIASNYIESPLALRQSYVVKQPMTCPECNHAADWHDETGCTISYCNCKKNMKILIFDTKETQKIQIGGGSITISNSGDESGLISFGVPDDYVDNRPEGTNERLLAEFEANKDRDSGIKINQ